MRAAVQWLLDRQITFPGDWKVQSPKLDGGGWAFQRTNRHYPDIDDTAVALLILHRVRAQLSAESTLQPQFADAIERATQWLLGMQCSNGGWGAYDRDNTHAWLTKIPIQ